MTQKYQLYMNVAIDALSGQSADQAGSDIDKLVTAIVGAFVPHIDYPAITPGPDITDKLTLGHRPESPQDPREINKYIENDMDKFPKDSTIFPGNNYEKNEIPKINLPEDPDKYGFDIPSQVPIDFGTIFLQKSRLKSINPSPLSSRFTTLYEAMEKIVTEVFGGYFGGGRLSQYLARAKSTLMSLAGTEISYARSMFIESAEEKKMRATLEERDIVPRDLAGYVAKVLDGKTYFTI